MRAGLIERLRLRQDLEIAVDSRAVRAAFQPIVDMETGRPIAAEALARWTHPERGAVPPMEFIPVAEETDLILRLGRQILTDACLRLGEWQRLGIVNREFMMSVNLSARQLEDPSLVAFVMSVIDEARIDPHCLILELTESAILQESPIVAQQIEGLRGIGTRLAIDDFGTGYSSLNYLRQLPIQILKIDRSFVTDLDLVLDNRSLIGTILSLGEGMDLRTVAEGIERQGQVDVLRSLGCRYGQGYLFSRPLDGEAFVSWVAAGTAARLAAAAEAEAASAEAEAAAATTGPAGATDALAGVPDQPPTSTDPATVVAPEGGLDGPAASGEAAA
jgi:EAL domain-containing protein (putative c-di-GMP-specific phosphodiesterase class I)